MHVLHHDNLTFFPVKSSMAPSLRTAKSKSLKEHIKRTNLKSAMFSPLCPLVDVSFADPLIQLGPVLVPSSLVSEYLTRGADKIALNKKL